MTKLLVINDDRQTLEAVRSSMEFEGVTVLTAITACEGFGIFVSEMPRMVVLDLASPGVHGLELLHRFVEADPGAEIILITGDYSAELAMEALREGAADCLPKPLDLCALRARVRKFIAHAHLRSESLSLEKQLLESFQFEGIVGRSPQILDVCTKLRRIASHYSCALLTGPTGSGKELVARALHNLSPVSTKPFAVCNCAALVDTSIESELFGYVRGAFTGGTAEFGLFEYANGGTVLLDEIGEMPLPAQAKLLRMLQSQEVQPVGSPGAKRVDVRVIAATHRDLRAMVKNHLFREDLYYRLSMVEIALPPLADRREDLPLLERFFVEKFSRQYRKQIKGITRRGQALLARHSWPGNIRELENAIGHACMMTENSVIDIKDLPLDFLQLSHPAMAHSPEPLATMEDVQQRHLLRVLDTVGGDKKLAAKILGISRSTVYNLLAKVEAKGLASPNPDLHVYMS